METAERNRRRLNGRSHRYFRHPSLVALLPTGLCHSFHSSGPSSSFLGPHSFHS